MYNSLLLHIEHDELTGFSHHHGRHATLGTLTLGKVGAIATHQGLKVHQLAGKAKHRISAHLVRSPVCSAARHDLLQEDIISDFGLCDLDLDVSSPSVPRTTSSLSASSLSCLGSVLLVAPSPGSPRAVVAATGDQKFFELQVTAHLRNASCIATHDNEGVYLYEFARKLGVEVEDLDLDFLEPDTDIEPHEQHVGVRSDSLLNEAVFSRLEFRFETLL
mmetsp:Transcript_40155/g.102024  ORF Transcript_40155/g.102024 Transcript_40155/m.102024 type:complete len:219 (-) Transcript_40155:151-807(-)